MIHHFQCSNPFLEPMKLKYDMFYTLFIMFQYTCKHSGQHKNKRVLYVMYILNRTIIGYDISNVIKLFRSKYKASPVCIEHLQNSTNVYFNQSYEMPPFEKVYST